MPTSSKRRIKPSSASLRAHSYYTLSERQRRRLASGQVESDPSQYNAGVSDTFRAQSEARRILEERRWLKELDLD